MHVCGSLRDCCCSGGSGAIEIAISAVADPGDGDGDGGGDGDGDGDGGGGDHHGGSCYQRADLHSRATTFLSSSIRRQYPSSSSRLFSVRIYASSCSVFCNTLSMFVLQCFYVTL